MYRMIAIDLDDTLLTDDLTITPGTIKAIRQAMDAGVVVTVATGRMFPSAVPFASQLGINVPLITYQGALIKDIEGKETLYERLVSPEISRRLIELARRKNIHLQVYQDDTLYSAVDNDKIQEYAKFAGVPYKIEPDLEKLSERGFIKLLHFEDPEVLDVLAEELAQEFKEEAHITKSKSYFLEVMHPEANKGKAVLFLAERLGIEPAEIIGIGDSYNDLDLLEAAGLGVAMGNAPDAIKERADYVTLSNNEEGVRHVIEKFILNKNR
ncbi:Cof-type HAD-IIB family hydrolase [Aneurinibacillus tyrosinisolvens]|uniref:Cof-type HAD-IIB family hydrolase n=1 Tax=Aneurinibacillus tyrosinisolvens TaxID=1443435 RepID=UPI00063F56C4|nr:Cof-type HAD-IIB family hydrolase [Aneurinibacillus tyrosinisolvens]